MDYEAEYQRYREKGLSALAQSKLTDAIEALGRAALFHPNDPVAHFNLGRSLFAAGKIEAARQSYLRALDLNPESSETRLALLALPALPPGRDDFRVNQLIHAPDLELAFWVLEVKKGGFGSVYVVEEWPGGLPALTEEGKRWTASTADSVLKAFQARYIWSDDDRKRFEREAVHWIMLDRHPNIVSARGMLVIEGFPCLWLEYLPYSLAELLRAGPLSPKIALELSIQFCDGMFYANQKLGLVHRDIKPSNCLLTKDMHTLKVSDWGLSRVFNDVGERSLELAGFSPEVSSQFTTVAGTPQYMAPEQFQLAVLDTRADIYSFGIMLYEMLTKDLPPIGYLASFHLENCFPAQRISPMLRRLILSCVQPNPQQRPNNFQELRRALASVYHDSTGTSALPQAEPLEMSIGELNDKGVALRRLGYHDEARACFKRAMDVSPDHPILLQNYASELQELGRFEEALACIERGLQIDPDSAGLWGNKGIVLKSMNNLEQANICFERMLDVKSHGLSYYQLRDMVALFNDAGNLESALKCCDAALSCNKRDADLWSYKAIILVKSGRYEEALASCKEGLAVEPRNHELWNIQAAVLLPLERFEEGLIACDRGIEIDPNCAALWENKGLILRALGKTHAAEKCFERAKTLKS